MEGLLAVLLLDTEALMVEMPELGLLSLCFLLVKKTPGVVWRPLAREESTYKMSPGGSEVATCFQCLLALLALKF